MADPAVQVLLPAKAAADARGAAFRPTGHDGDCDEKQGGVMHFRRPVTRHLVVRIFGEKMLLGKRLEWLASCSRRSAGRT